MSNRLVPGVLVVAALVVAAVVVLMLVGAAEEEPVTVGAIEPSELSTVYPSNRLVGLSLERVTGYGPATQRREFAVCVDGAAGRTIYPTDVESIREVVEEALRESPETRYRVVRGCPPPVGLTRERLDEHERHSLDVARVVEASDVPSAYSLALYIVPAELYEASFEDGYPYALSYEELVCEGDSEVRCSAASGGLYVKPGISQDQVLYAILNYAGAVPNPVRACLGQMISEPWWCDEFWKDLGVTPPTPTGPGS